MNAEDALAVIWEESMPKERESAREDRRGRKRERKDRQASFDRNKRRDDKILETVKFTLLVMPVDKILVQIKDDHHLEWPKSLHSSPNVRDNKKHYRFHKDHGHYIGDCRELKE